MTIIKTNALMKALKFLRFALLGHSIKWKITKDLNSSLRLKPIWSIVELWKWLITTKEGQSQMCLLKAGLMARELTSDLTRSGLMTDTLISLKKKLIRQRKEWREEIYQEALKLIPKSIMKHMTEPMKLLPPMYHFILDCIVHPSNTIQQ